MVDFRTDEGRSRARRKKERIREKERDCFGRDERKAVKKSTFKENCASVGKREGGKGVGWTGREWNGIVKRGKRYKRKVLDATKTVVGGWSGGKGVFMSGKSMT